LSPALGSAVHRLCVVMICTDMSEADQIGRQLLKLNSGCLVTYLRLEELMFLSPAGKVALVILAANDTPTMTRRTLSWLRHRWPGCPITVVADAGGGEQEVAAREGGANFLTRPVPMDQWREILRVAAGKDSAVQRRELT